MSERLCATCRHWTKVRVEGPGVPGIPGTPAMGTCRRYAPRPSVGTGHAHVVWPMTAAGEVCGEWEAPDASSGHGHPAAAGAMVEI